VDAWENLTRLESEAVRLSYLFWHGKGQAAAIRQVSWKMHFNDDQENPTIPELKEGVVLYDLTEDAKESKILKNESPLIIGEILRMARKQIADVYENQVPIGTWPSVEVPDPPLKAEEVWGKWMK
jgi:hypothetical protein